MSEHVQGTEDFKAQELRSEGHPRQVFCLDRPPSKNIHCHKVRTMEPFNLGLCSKDEMDNYQLSTVPLQGSYMKNDIVNQHLFCRIDASLVWTARVQPAAPYSLWPPHKHSTT